jgi:hypothetical protein
MWIHKKLKVAFIPNPRSGSREIGYEILAARKFERWLGHHGVPWSPDQTRHGNYEQKGELWWWFNQDPLEWRFFATHRNHFEVFHSIGRAVLGNSQRRPQDFKDYLWRHPALYRSCRVLFPSFVEIAHCRAIRFDNLRGDVAALFEEWDLPRLKDSEGHRANAKHHTIQKPKGEHYSDYLSRDVRAWIEENYALEMERFGYRWEEKPGDAGASPDVEGSDGE